MYLPFLVARRTRYITPIKPIRPTAEAVPIAVYISRAAPNDISLTGSNESQTDTLKHNAHVSTNWFHSNHVLEHAQTDM